MTIVHFDESIRDFQFWSGGQTIYNSLTEEEKNFLEEYLEEITDMPNEPMTPIEINDFMWFEAEQVLIDNGFREEAD